MEKLESIENVSYLKVFVRGIIISLLSTLILILILSIAITFTSLKEGSIKPAVIFISAFSILLGSFSVSRKIMKKGIIYGGMLGAIYMILIYLVSSFANYNFSININSIIMILTGILGGCVGGILGVNLK